MIDIHSHIIPNVDDGSNSVSETYNMIVEAEKAGFTDICLTSHFLLDYYETNANELVFWKDELQKILFKKNINVKLHSGMEIYITNKIEELMKENRLLSLANSKYILIELPLGTNIAYLDYVIDYLKSVSKIPIIAHPERYKYVQENPELVGEYIKKGALIQCNYGSILELYGKESKKAFRYLLKNDWVHFLGSDCHRDHSIYILIPDAIKKITKIVGNLRFEEMSEINPKKILEDKDWDN